MQAGRMSGSRVRAVVGWMTATLALALAGAAVAEQPPVRVELSRFTFGSRIGNRSWTPVQTRVRNDLDTPIELGVVIGFDVAGRAGERVNYLRRVRLPAHSSRTIENYVLLDIPPVALLPLLNTRAQSFSYSDGTVVDAVRYTAKPLSINTRVIHAVTGQEFEGCPLMGIPGHPDSRMIVVVDGEPDHYVTNETYTLRGQPFTLGEHDQDMSAFDGGPILYSGAFTGANYPVADGGSTAVDSTRVASHDLPEKWAAYEGIHAVILGSLRSRQGPQVLTPQQRHSLLRWVRSGGRLVLVPGGNLDAYRHPFWEQLLPVRLLDTRFAGTEIDVLQGRFANELPFDRGYPPLVPEAIRGAGEVLLGDGERVLLARRRVGNGTVWFVGFAGESLRDWSSGPAFWHQVLKSTPSAVPGLKDAFANSAPLNLARIVGAAAPSKAAVIGLLSAYVLLGVGALVLFRILGRPEYGWPVLMLLAVLGLLGALIIGANTRAKVGLVQGELGVTVLGRGESQGSATSFVGIYAPRAMRTDVVWTNPDTLATAHPGNLEGDAGAQIVRSLTVDQGDHFAFSQVRLNPGELTVARAMTLVHYGEGIDARVGFGRNGLSGFVQNRTGQPLRDCILRLNRRTVRIGDLAPGERRDLAELPLSWRLSSSEFQISGGAQAELRRDLLAEILRIPHVNWLQREREYTWPVAFYGWAGEVQASMSLGQGPAPAERAMHVLALPVGELNVEGDVFLPAGVCGLRLIGASSRQAYGHSRGGVAAGDVRLPQITRIAGMRRLDAGPVAAAPAADGLTTEIPGAVANEALDAGEARDFFRPLGWNSGSVPLTARIGFTLPEGLAGLQVTKLVLTTAVELSNLRGTIGVRRVGEREFTVLEGVDLAAESAETEVPGLDRFLGAAGELPEFEIRFQRPATTAGAQLGHWSIREFDVKVWGRMPERQQP